MSARLKMKDDGWTYEPDPEINGGDARKLVTLVDRRAGMCWVGIRVFNNSEWFNGSEPEPHYVKAWRDLPEPARKEWVGGVLEDPFAPLPGTDEAIAEIKRALDAHRARLVADALAWYVRESLLRRLAGEAQ